MAMDNRTEATEKVRRRNVAPSGPSFKLAGNESAAALGVVFATELTVEPRKNHFVILRVSCLRGALDTALSAKTRRRKDAKNPYLVHHFINTVSYSAPAGRKEISRG